MVAKLAALWVAVRDSLWFVPALVTLAAIVLAFLSLEVDRLVGPDERAQHSLLFGGGAESARGVLGAIATGIITVTGVTFSVTIIALQLASSQFTPRVLRNFTADRGNQLVLGVLIGTFTFALLVQRAVRGEAEGVEAFIPSVSVTIAVGLTLLSIGFFIFFIDHLARSIQASVLIDRVTADALDLVDRLFPAPLGRPASEEGADGRRVPAGPPAQIAADAAGYLQVVDEQALFHHADNHAATVRMEVRIGEFLLPGAALASVWPAEAADEELTRRIRSAFVLGVERNLRQDLELAIVELVDIAIKGLSPSVNDPTTAMNCIDRLGQVLLALSHRESPPRWRTDERGRLRFLARRPEFQRIAELAFNQIRHFGAGQPAVAARTIHTLGRTAELARTEHRDALIELSESVVHASRQSVADPHGLRIIGRAQEEAGSALSRTSAEPGPSPPRATGD